VREQIFSLEKKANQLEKTLESADQMVHELNNLSDYIVSHVEDSNIIYEKSLNNLNDKIRDGDKLAQRLRQLIDECKISEDQLMHIRTLLENNDESKSNFSDESKPQQCELLSFSNSKYIEAANLSQQGLSIREIAHRLNMGQEEIRLVLGTRKSNE
jgi:DNA-binding NarL/FixJ family response regulator